MLVREPCHYLVTDDLIKFVSTDLVGAAIAELKDATRFYSTQREVERPATPVNDEHVASHESANLALRVRGTTQVPVQSCEWFVNELGY